MDQRLWPTAKPDINEIRWVCAQCMAERKRYIPPETEVPWIGAECNFCRLPRVVTNVEYFTDTQLRWERA